MNKRLLPVGCVILTLILVLFVPFPARVNATLSGARIKRGAAVNDISMTLKGWRLRSVLRGDRLSATLSIAPFGADSKQSLTLPAKGAILGRTGYRIVFDRYSSSQNGYVVATLYFTGDFSQMLYCDEADGESAYVAYSGGNADAQEVADALRGGDLKV